MLVNKKRFHGHHQKGARFLQPRSAKKRRVSGEQTKNLRGERHEDTLSFQCLVLWALALSWHFNHCTGRPTSCLQHSSSLRNRQLGHSNTRVFLLAMGSRSDHLGICNLMLITHKTPWSLVGQLEQSRCAWCWDDVLWARLQTKLCSPQASAYASTMALMWDA